MQPRIHTALLLIFCSLPCAATACGPQETTDQSQRLLPFPQQQPSNPGVHVELLRRLRDALQQSRPEPQPQPQTNSDSNSAEPPQPQTPTPPETIPPNELLDLSQSLQNLADRIPPGLVPRGLSEMPPEQLQKSLQHPDTQQSLRKLLEQFRSDGLLPPPSENGTPIPGPPRQTPPSNQPDRTKPAIPQIEPQPQPQPQPDMQPAPQPDLQPRRQPTPSPRLRPDSTPQPNSTPRPAPQPGTIPRPQSPPTTEPVPPADTRDTPTPNLSRDALRRLEDFFNELRQNSPAPPSPPNTLRGQPSPNLIPPPRTEQPQTPPNPSRRTPLRRRDRPQPGQPPVPPENKLPNTQPDPNTQPAPNTSPQSSNPQTSRSRSLFDSLERILKEPTNPPSPGDTIPDTPVPPQPAPGQTPPAQPPQPAAPSQQPFSIPDFLKQQLNDPQLRNLNTDPEQPDNSASRNPSAPPLNPADPNEPTDPSNPSPPAEPAPRTRPPVNLDPSQNFRDSFRQLLNEARQEAREQNSLDQQPRPNSPPTDTPQTSPRRPQPPPPPPAPAPPPGPNRAESLLRMLDDLAKTPDRRQGQSGLRPVPQTRSDNFLPRPEPPRSLLDNLLGGSQSQAPEPAAAAEIPAPGESGDNPNSSSPRLDLSAAPSALSLGATLAVALGALWLLLKFAGQRRLLATSNSASERPLPPEQIHSRPDIVAAYHQLARRTVRNFRPWWHHRQIETLLQQSFPGRKAAITHLAGVYEQSRYAPDSFPLSQTDLQTAREAIRQCQQ